MGRVVEPEERALQFVTPAWTAGTKGVLRGKAVLAPIDEEGLEKVKESLKGALGREPAAGAGRAEASAGFPRKAGQGFMTTSTSPASFVPPGVELVVTDWQLPGFLG